VIALFHVSSAANRDSIGVHGLDWTQMGAAAGSGFSYYPAKIPPGQVMMFRQAPQNAPEDHHRRARKKQAKKTPR
jgi:hypothetical protein